MHLLPSQIKTDTEIQYHLHYRSRERHILLLELFRVRYSRVAASIPRQAVLASIQEAFKRPLVEGGLRPLREHSSVTEISPSSLFSPTRIPLRSKSGNE